MFLTDIHHEYDVQCSLQTSSYAVRFRVQNNTKDVDQPSERSKKVNKTSIIGEQTILR